MEGLPGRKEHLGTFLGRHAPLEDGQLLSQGPPREADSDINTPRLRSAYGQANHLAPRKAKVRTTDRTRYEAHQNALRRAPSEATRKRQQEGIRVSVVLEPEAGRKPKICLPGAGSVGEPVCLAV